MTKIAKSQGDKDSFEYIHLTQPTYGRTGDDSCLSKVLSYQVSVTLNFKNIGRALSNVHRTFPSNVREKFLLDVQSTYVTSNYVRFGRSGDV